MFFFFGNVRSPKCLLIIDKRKILFNQLYAATVCVVTSQTKFLITNLGSTLPSKSVVNYGVEIYYDLNFEGPAASLTVPHNDLCFIYKITQNLLAMDCAKSVLVTLSAVQRLVLVSRIIYYAKSYEFQIRSWNTKKGENV